MRGRVLAVRVALLLLGLTVAHLGVTLFLQSDLGSDPFNVLVQGFYRALPWPDWMTHGRVHLLLSFLIVLVLLAAVATALLSTQARLNAAQADQEELSRQVQAQREANAALEEGIARSADTDYLAYIARSRLGLMEPGEIEFVDSSK